MPYYERSPGECLHFTRMRHCSDFIAKYECPQNSSDLNPLDYYEWAAMLQAFRKLNAKPKTIPELKSALQQIWDDLQ